VPPMKTHPSPCPVPVTAECSRYRPGVSGSSAGRDVSGHHDALPRVGNGVS
jgi:hypothetical protein